MSVGISFGSATSGTGFDVAATVASIMAVQRTPETAWATQTTALQAQDTVLSTLATDASAVSTALASLTGFDGVFSAMTGATSDSGTVALTSVGRTASAGLHTITVSQLAKTSKQFSDAVATSSTIAGTLKLTAGSSSEVEISLGSNGAGVPVAQAAKQINAANAGVTATVITDSNGSRLSLTSATSGAAGELRVDSSGVTDSSGNTVSFTESQAGQDARYTLDGASLSSSSNTISSALTGVTFQLLAPTSTSGSGAAGSSVAMEIVADTSSVASTLGSFVTAYNTLITALAGQETNDASGAAEPLFGNPLVSQMQSSLAAALTFTGAGSSSSGSALSLTSLGITTNTDGTLSLDTDTLSSALSNRLSDVQTFFQTGGNFGQNFVTTMNNLGSAGTGAIALAKTANSTTEKTLADEKTNLEARLATYQTALTAELTTANEILQAIPTQLSEISSMFDAINGTSGK